MSADILPTGQAVESRLGACVDCGGTVSKQAIRCPRCRSKRPHGVQCMCCGERGRESNMMRSHDLVCHRSCLEAKFKVPADFLCPDCGEPLAGVASPLVAPEGEATVACGNCGRPLGGTSVCPVCGLPICDFQKQIKGRLRSSVDYVYHDDSSFFLHDFCAEVKNAKLFLEQPWEANQEGATPWSYMAAVAHDLAVALKISRDDYWVIRSRAAQDRLRAVGWLVTLVGLASVWVLIRKAVGH